jgi:16S rRNA G1207 methylase RsmC
MNPPFEHGQDAKHVKHAFDFLKPGGRLVAIMANGAQFAKFSPWLEDRGGWSEELPSDAFTGKDAFRQTGVSTRLVVIDN